MPLELYNALDVVVVPFPFVDTLAAKRRPALVLSNAETFNGKAHSCVLAMITTSVKHAWPLDYALADWSEAGLPVASNVRMKLFTLDSRLILHKIGRLSERDGKEVQKNLNALFK